MFRASSAQIRGCLRFLMRALCVLGLLMSLSSLASAADQPRPSPKLNDIIQAMEANGERAGAVSIHWREVVHFAKGGLIAPEQAQFLGIEGPAAKTGIPAREMRADFPSELLLKGSWMKYSTKDGGPGPTERQAILDSMSAYDGVESRDLTSNAAERVLYGNILTRAENTASHEGRLLPLLLYLRPFAEPFHNLNKRKLRVKAADAIVNHAHCVVVSDGLTSVWLDTARGCVPVVIEAYRPNGDKDYHAEVEYAADDVLFWAPKRTRVELYNIPHPTHIDVSYEASDIVIKSRLSLSQRDFALVFPLGTAVYDGPHGTRYRVGPNGSKIPIGETRTAK
jgi:hypothetical protein